MRFECKYFDNEKKQAKKKPDLTRWFLRHTVKVAVYYVFLYCFHEIVIFEYVRYDNHCVEELFMFLALYVE